MDVCWTCPDDKPILLEYDTLRVYIRKGARFHCLSYLPTWYGETYIQWRDYVYNQLHALFQALFGYDYQAFVEKR